VVGAGIFTLPAALAAGAGSWSPFVLLVTVALASAMALCLVEVASRYDVTGGPMVYAGDAFARSPGSSSAG
jgi:amino acid transporter